MHKNATYLLPLQYGGLHCWAPVPLASSLLRLLTPPVSLLPRFRENASDFPLAQPPRERLAITAAAAVTALHEKSLPLPDCTERKGTSNGLPCPAQEGRKAELPAQLEA